MCFSYDAGCHVILYVILTASNTFTDWQLIFSCFFLRWPFDSLELFSSSSELLFCCPVDHACTTHSIRIGEVIIWFSFSVVSTKIEICWFPCCTRIKLVLRCSGPFVSLSSCPCPTQNCQASGVTMVSAAALIDAWQCWDWDKKCSSVLYSLLDLRRRCWNSF